MGIKTKRLGVYYLDLEKGPQDVLIHAPILEAGDKRFKTSQAGEDAIHRYITKFGLTEAEAIGIIRGSSGMP